MYLYSGKCKLCECGRETKFKDIDGDPLFTGDIVIIYTVDAEGVLGFMGGMTAIVSDDYENYVGSDPAAKDELEEPFVMGIKSVRYEADWEGWNVKKVKSYDAVVDGEQWKAYGFNYRLV